MNKQRASAGANRPSQSMSTDFDDWETDPDYVRDMDEMDQRWGGTKRTVGSINMNDLIDQVNREHKLIREKYQHPSQRLGEFGEEILNRNPSRDPVRVSEERMSKHSSTQEISRKVYTSASGSESGIKDDISPRSFIEKTTSTSKPTIATKPDFINYTRTSTPLKTFTPTEPKRLDTSERIVKTESSSSPFKESSTTKRIFKEEKTSSASSSRDHLHESPAFKSIQDKIDAFKKEFEDLESRVSRKSDFSKLIKKTSNYETRQSSADNYVPRNEARPSSSSPSSSSSAATKSFAKQSDIYVPKTDIRGLSKRFETLCRESDEEFKRRTDARRREFFDQIKNQVRETRKNLDGFDTIDDESELSGKPKVYTRSETTKEEIVSKVVKENDKIVENETKRNVERSSSCHGSSDDEQVEPTSIKYLNQQMSESPSEQFRAKSPIDEIKSKVPIVVPEIKGAGLMARTLYDYQAAEDDELSFDVDDLITNIDKVDKQWYRGTITKSGQRQVGLFPANYVKLLNDTSEY